MMIANTIAYCLTLSEIMYNLTFLPHLGVCVLSRLHALALALLAG